MSVFFRELQTLTRSGITLAPACREIERRSPRHLSAMARDMAEAAESGKPVSTAMEAHRALLYPWHLGVVRAAEAGGFIPEAFEQIAHAYEVEWDTRSALRLRFFFYVVMGLPAVLLSLPLILTIRQPIPSEGWTPETVIGTVKHYFRTVSFPIAAGVSGIISVWQVLQSIAWFQGVQQQIVSRLPVVGRAARAAALDRYLATLGLMLRGGLPIAQAAEEAAMAAGNTAITPKLLDFVPRLREGASLSELLAESRLLDTDTLNMAATGEVSGSLPDMLARAAGYYREENEAKRKMLIRLAQVLFGVAWIVAMGSLILFGIKVYFDFAFKTMNWMLEGFE
jgi:type II secretory pathway component PulF